MANRTVKFIGLAYGDTPVQITAEINGQTVYNGTVTTIQTAPPALPNDNLLSNPVLFELTDSTLFPTEFSGMYPMSISVTGGYGIVIQDVNCNYMLNTDPVSNVLYTGNATGFSTIYKPNQPPNSEGTPDCRSSVTIDGVVQVPPLPLSQSTWEWSIPAGSTLACNFNVSLGNVG